MLYFVFEMFQNIFFLSLEKIKINFIKGTRWKFKISGNMEIYYLESMTWRILCIGLLQFNINEIALTFWRAVG